MAGKVEDSAVGFPGFIVMRPPRISRTGATLKRVALAKLSDITLMSAEFDGESLLFEPWLTLMVDYGTGAFSCGVYRTDSSSGTAVSPPNGRVGGGAGREPGWCLRKSEWIRAKDHEQSRAAGDLRDYLRSGAQVDHQLVFADRGTHPELDDAMDGVLAGLASGIAVSPSPPRDSEWHFVALDLADARLVCSIEYSPLIAKCAAIETALPGWLDRMEEFLRTPGLSPDGKIRISVRRSVPEMTRAEIRSQGGVAGG